MRKLLNKENINKGIILLFITAVIFWVGFCGGTGEVETTTETNMRGFTLILWSILFEALPFVLLGTIISSLIQVYVSEQTIIKILPRNNFLRLITASLIGLIFPRLRMCNYSDNKEPDKEGNACRTGFYLHDRDAYC